VEAHPEAVIALGRLRMMAAAGDDPTLSDDELRACLAANATTDTEARLTTDEAWVPTYALGAAAQDAWLMKAGKAAHRVTGGDGALRLERSALHAHCLAMADRYALRRFGSIPLAPTTGERERVPVLNGDGPATMMGAEPAPGGASW
jgi:hypothetical protein